MMATFSFLIYLFLLNVGRTPDDAREFARIRGEWDVVGIEMAGKKLPPEVWQGKEVIIGPADGAAGQPAHSLAYWGRLNTRRNPHVIESRLLSISVEMPPDAKNDAPEDPLVPPYPVPGSSMFGAVFQTLYEIDGDKMRLLVTQVVDKNAKLPTKVVSNAIGGGMLFDLRRKSRVKAAAPTSGKEGQGSSTRGPSARLVGYSVPG